MGPAKKTDLHEDDVDPIVGKVRETIAKYRNIVISGEVGVGKITKTLEALHDRDNVYYIGNPVDYVGQPRPKGYEKYLDYITSLKKDMTIISEEKEIVSYDFSSLPEQGAVLIIDEIYGRSVKEYRKILKILDIEALKVVMITGCLKYIGKIAEKIDMALMLAPDGTLLVDKEFVKMICKVLGPDKLDQTGLFS